MYITQFELDYTDLKTKICGGKNSEIVLEIFRIRQIENTKNGFK